MSETLNELIASQEKRFTALDEGNGHLLDWKQECLFARQQVLKNKYTTDVAANAPHTLQAAILNVAAIGISLNPALQHAFLVPRDNQICLDISFRGLVKLATDSGAILWAKTELVNENDTFVWKGPNEAPLHEADVFGDRGEVIGGYCLAKLPDGTVMVEIMKRDVMDKIQQTSKAANGPWKTWPDEMRKKSVTKRASKSWPQTAGRSRLDKAVQVMHEAEGSAFTLEEQGKWLELLRSEDALGFFLYNSSLSEGAQIALFNSFEKGQKGKDKDHVRDMVREGSEIFQSHVADLGACLDSDDAEGVNEILTDYVGHEGRLISLLSPEHQQNVQEVL